jgi:hypothetical protein
MEVLRYLEAIAVIIAAAAVTTFSVRAFLLAKRVHRLADQCGQVLEEDVKRTLAGMEETTRRARETLGRVDASLLPFEQTVRRIERWTAAVATEAIVASTLSPALAKVSGWLSGVRKGVGSVLKR